MQDETTLVAQIGEPADAQLDGCVRWWLSALFYSRIFGLPRGADVSDFPLPSCPNPWERRAAAWYYRAIVGSGKLLLLAALIGIPVGCFRRSLSAEFGGHAGALRVVRHTADFNEWRASHRIVNLCLRCGSHAGAPFFRRGRRFRPRRDDDSHCTTCTEEFSRRSPRHARRCDGYLGASKWRTISSVVLPAASRGIMTAALPHLASGGWGDGAATLYRLSVTAIGVLVGAS